VCAIASIENIRQFQTQNDNHRFPHPRFCHFFFSLIFLPLSKQVSGAGTALMMTTSVTPMRTLLPYDDQIAELRRQLIEAEQHAAGAETRARACSLDSNPTSALRGQQEYWNTRMVQFQEEELLLRRRLLFAMRQQDRLWSHVMLHDGWVAKQEREQEQKGGMEETTTTTTTSTPSHPSPVTHPVPTSPFPPPPAARTTSAKRSAATSVLIELEQGMAFAHPPRKHARVERVCLTPPPPLVPLFSEKNRCAHGALQTGEESKQGGHHDDSEKDHEQEEHGQGAPPSNPIHTDIASSNEVEADETDDEKEHEKDNVSVSDNSTETDESCCIDLTKTAMRITSAAAEAIVPAIVVDVARFAPSAVCMYKSDQTLDVQATTRNAIRLGVHLQKKANLQSYGLMSVHCRAGIYAGTDTFLRCETIRMPPMTSAIPLAPATTKLLRLVYTMEPVSLMGGRRPGRGEATMFQRRDELEREDDGEVEVERPRFRVWVYRVDLIDALNTTFSHASLTYQFDRLIKANQTDDVQHEASHYCRLLSHKVLSAWLAGRSVQTHEPIRSWLRDTLLPVMLTWERLTMSPEVSTSGNVTALRNSIFRPLEQNTASANARF